ncbi:hypothetical protein TrispH2_011409 [Trichoplax sp. H2]|nr:hypothetical protein TrispH2_011409 [Trichoplax sp. H2]|eukprot:RDD36521.1 hypothetical protein TrispH2_011409 [Trichoplax sp. H2]
MRILTNTSLETEANNYYQRKINYSPDGIYCATVCLFLCDFRRNLLNAVVVSLALLIRHYRANPIYAVLLMHPRKWPWSPLFPEMLIGLSVCYFFLSIVHLLPCLKEILDNEDDSLIKLSMQPYHFPTIEGDFRSKLKNKAWIFFHKYIITFFHIFNICRISKINRSSNNARHDPHRLNGNSSDSNMNSCTNLGSNPNCVFRFFTNLLMCIIKIKNQIKKIVIFIAKTIFYLPYALTLFAIFYLIESIIEMFIVTGTFLVVYASYLSKPLILLTSYFLTFQIYLKKYEKLRALPISKLKELKPQLDRQIAQYPNPSLEDIGLLEDLLYYDYDSADQVKHLAIRDDLFQFIEDKIFRSKEQSFYIFCKILFITFVCVILTVALFILYRVDSGLAFLDSTSDITFSLSIVISFLALQFQLDINTSISDDEVLLYLLLYSRKHRSFCSQYRSE